MQIVPIVTPLLVLMVLAPGCSSDPAPSKATLTPPDASVIVPPSTPDPGPITLIVKGQGTVGAEDGSVTCKSEGPANGASCPLKHPDVTLYPFRAYGWAFDHWEPSMSTKGSLYVATWSASTLTAVFVEVPAIVDASTNVGD